MKAIKNSKLLTFFGALLALALAACSQPKDSLGNPDLPQKVLQNSLENQCNSLYATNARGKRVSWKGAVPIRFVFDPRFPPDFVANVEAAMEMWNQAAGTKLFESQGFRKEKSLPTYDEVNTIYFVDGKDPVLAAAAKALYKDDGNIAVTRLSYLGNKLLDTDIIFDGVDYTFSNSSFHVDSFDVEAIALHELGHALGLGHNKEDPNSIMYFGTSGYGFSARYIDSTSQQMLQCEYDTKL